jgi:tRNA(Ile)-lysidine synthetase-like protein
MSDVFQEELKYLPEKCNILVSISGGVDSMVCLLLTKICAPGKNVTCVHINYNNRQECSLETEFINKFCSILNTKFYYRKIKEISREKCHGSGLRELYEDVTKQIRFDMYKQVMLSEGYDTTNTYVVMGHNADDCFENIITNINNKHSYNNLHGMERISQIDDINFFRPLLKIRKSDIIEFAHSNNIPYLKDSTPKWSMRGKIRDNILPVMESINKNTIESYFHLCDHLHRSDKLIKNYIIPNVLKSFYNEQNTIVGYFDQPELSQLINEHDVWKTIFLSDKFESVFQKLNSSFKSIKEFSNFLMRYLSVNNKGRCKFVLRKDINVTLEQKDNKLKLSFIEND